MQPQEQITKRTSDIADVVVTREVKFSDLIEHRELCKKKLERLTMIHEVAAKPLVDELRKAEAEIAKYKAAGFTEGPAVDPFVPEIGPVIDQG